MLRMKNSELRLTTQGYHFDKNGKKFVRVYMSMYQIKIQVKVQRHKEMHIMSIDTSFPYRITDNWVEIIVNLYEIPYKNVFSLNDYIDQRCTEIWFV